MPLTYSQLPVSPMPQQQPTIGQGGPQEQQMQMAMQMLQQRASDPTARLQMAQQLAKQLPPPPDNIFSGVRMPSGHQALPQQQQNPLQAFSGLGAMMQPMMAGGGAGPGLGQMGMPGANGPAAMTNVPTNGMAAMAPTQGVPGFPMLQR